MKHYNMYQFDELPPVSELYEAADFPGKDVPRYALQILLNGGWTDADDAVKSLRSVIAGYEESIQENADKKRKEEEAEWRACNHRPIVSTHHVLTRRRVLCDRFYRGVDYGRLLPAQQAIVDHMIALELAPWDSKVEGRTMSWVATDDAQGTKVAW